MELGNVSDDRIVAAARDGLARTFTDVEPRDIERVFREELAAWRDRSRVQAFVPVFAERSAVERIRMGRLASN